jgi:hypothetical protein
MTYAFFTKTYKLCIKLFKFNNTQNFQTNKTQSPACISTTASGHRNDSNLN